MYKAPLQGLIPRESPDQSDVVFLGEGDHDIEPSCKMTYLPGECRYTADLSCAVLSLATPWAAEAYPLYPVQ